MNSYFFIPANNRKFLSNASAVNSDYLILDLEDAIFNSNIEVAVKNILEFEINKDSFVRINLDLKEQSAGLGYIKPLLDYGYRRFVLPKIETTGQLDKVIAMMGGLTSPKTSKFEIILLLESPLAMVNIKELIQNSSIAGIGLGSHDYCASLGMQHDLANLAWARMEVLNFAKAFGKNAIDVASMNVYDESQFELECLNGISLGFDAKFIIHPKQLAVLKGLKNYSKGDLTLALKVMQHIKDIGGVENFSIANIDGLVIERPHLKRISQILKQSGNESFSLR